MYDITSNVAMIRFLDVCTTTAGATAEAIDNMMNVKLGSLLSHSNPCMLRMYFSGSR